MADIQSAPVHLHPLIPNLIHKVCGFLVQKKLFARTITFHFDVTFVSFPTGLSNNGVSLKDT